MKVVVALVVGVSLVVVGSGVVMVVVVVHVQEIIAQFCHVHRTKCSGMVEISLALALMTQIDGMGCFFDCCLGLLAFLCYYAVNARNESVMKSVVFAWLNK